MRGKLKIPGEIRRLKLSWKLKGKFYCFCAVGASTGENEALELRDADGKGVSTAIKNVNEIIAPKLKGQRRIKPNRRLIGR